MKVELCDEFIREIVVNDLKWHYEAKLTPKKMRKAIRKTMAYYMTYAECVEYFGTKLTKELWDEQ
jgi:hypothetical protein